MKNKIILILISLITIACICFLFVKNNKQNDFENRKIDNENFDIKYSNYVEITADDILLDDVEKNAIKEETSNNVEKSENKQIENEISNEKVVDEKKNVIDDKNVVIENVEIKEEIVNNQQNNKVIVIDPGHQAKGNNEKEPIGPGATETKAKVTTGATGVATGQKESELNLSVAKLLQKELEQKGYTVIMTRTTQDVNMSNSERAKIANDANSDAFIRIHANSAESSSAKGVLTMCQTNSNEYNGDLADESYNLSKLVVDNIVKETGAQNRNVTRTDTMSGINWCTVPTTIVEMGFLSNPEEDKLMATEEYQKKIVKGIVNGLEEFFK